MSDKERKALLNKWQKAFRLQDWVIKLVSDCNPSGFGWTDDREGECVYVESTKTAEIRILDERFYGKRLIPYNYERILIHELLHIKFALLQDTGNELQDRVVHQIIDDLAKGIAEGI